MKYLNQNSNKSKIHIRFEDFNRNPNHTKEYIDTFENGTNIGEIVYLSLLTNKAIPWVSKTKGNKEHTYKPNSYIIDDIIIDGKHFEPNYTFIDKLINDGEIQFKGQERHYTDRVQKNMIISVKYHSSNTKR